jgi:DUF438 domain-containing protein
MGKGSGTCDRQGISLEASDNASPELNLSGNIAGINTTLGIHRVGKQWWTKDEAAIFQKRKSRGVTRARVERWVVSDKIGAWVKEVDHAMRGRGSPWKHQGQKQSLI